MNWTRNQGEAGMEDKALLLCTHGRVGGGESPYSQVGCFSWLYKRTEAASLAVDLHTWAKAAIWGAPQPSEMLCRHPAQTVLFRQERQWRQRGNSPKVHPEPLSLTAEFLGWRILELFTFLTLLRWAQVHSGGATVLFLHLWVWKAPLTGGQTDLLLSPARGGISNAS